MIDATAAPIGFARAVKEQLVWFWRRQWIWIVVASVLMVAASVWIVTSLEEQPRGFLFVVLGSSFHPMLVLIALSWAFSAWRDDPPKERQYFWLQPVERTTHTIARSLAAFLWLMLVVAIVVATVTITATAHLGAEALAGTARFWVFAAGSIALVYLAASIAPILSNRPGVWIVLVIAVVIIFGAVARIREIDWLIELLSWFQGGPRSFGTALGAPGVEAARSLMANVPPGEAMPVPAMERMREAQPAIALAIWLPISLVAWLGAARLSLPR